MRSSPTGLQDLVVLQTNMEKRVSEDEMAGWCHRCNGHELGQILEDSEEQGGLVCYTHRVAKRRTQLVD